MNSQEPAVHESDLPPLKVVEGKDEMNLAEFPLSAIADRLHPDQKSLNRWVGITLYYKNAWWSKKDKCWVDESFHILDNVKLYDREKPRPAQSQLPLSYFTWNDTIFRSFVDGNLKSLDFDFYRSLESSIAKRLYRFLDKRFFLRSRWEFNLKEVSWAHVGLARSYDAANLKRRLLIGIRELEIKGFFEPMPEGDRFRKVRSGDWSVLFEKTRANTGKRARPESQEAASPLVAALVERGITPSTARQTVTAHPADRIQAQLEIFDWLVSQKDRKVSKNPPGFLIASIKGEYAPPKGFISQEERQRRDAHPAMSASARSARVPNWT